MFTYKKLGDFTYHLIENEAYIKEYLLKWLEKEWKEDIEEYPDQPWSVEWLKLLHQMEFRLIKLNFDMIQLRQDLMDYNSETYNFYEHLLKRAEEMEESLLQGSSIGPLVINEGNMELMDGYTRYTVIKKFKQKSVYVYLGKKEH